VPWPTPQTLKIKKCKTVLSRTRIQNAKTCVFLGVILQNFPGACHDSTSLQLICDVTRLWRNFANPSEIFCVRHCLDLPVIERVSCLERSQVLSGSIGLALLKSVVFNLGRVPVEVVCLFSGAQELLIEIFIIPSEFHISYLEPLFAVTKTIGSPGKTDSLLYHLKLF